MEENDFTLAKQPQPSAPRSAGLLAALLYLGVYLAGQLLSAALFAGVVLLRLLRQTPGLAPAALMEALLARMGEQAVSLSLLSNLVTLLALALIWRLRKQAPAEAVQLRPVPFSLLWPLLPLGAALNGLFTLLLSLLPGEMLSGYTEASSALLSQTGLLPLLAVAFLGPLTEEIVFRGLLFHNLSKSVPVSLAALITSALFGAFHGQPVWMAYAFLAGLLFCLAFRRYGTLWASLLLHMSFNLSGGFSAALSLLPLPVALAVSGVLTAGFLLLAYEKSRELVKR